MTQEILDVVSWKEVLKNCEWEEGKQIHLPPGSYRHAVTVHCTKEGRQKASFANGENQPFAAYVRLVRPNGDWISEGNNIVPVLPNGKVLMVVEQRPAQFLWGNKPAKVVLDDGSLLDLAQFGFYSSLEFPGGAVDQEEHFRASFVRELVEEAGVESQTATLWMRRPFHTFGSDVALRAYLGVIELAALGFERKTENDGGLVVLDMMLETVQENIWLGNITAAQAALQGWDFFKEFHTAKAVGRLGTLIDIGYLTRKEVKIVK